MTLQRFEARDLQSSAKFVEPATLVVGETYFRVSFFDDDLLTPELIPLVYIGRDLHEGDVERWYFQDYGSFLDGIRYDYADARSGGVDDEKSSAIFEVFGGGESIVSVCDYEDALDQLLGCSLRRKRRGSKWLQ